MIGSGDREQLESRTGSESLRILLTVHCMRSSFAAEAEQKLNVLIFVLIFFSCHEPETFLASGIEFLKTDMK